MQRSQARKEKETFGALNVGGLDLGQGNHLTSGERAKQPRLEGTDQQNLRS
jgi:hypothetical protein